MSATTAFFDTPHSPRKYSRKSEKYFPSTPVKPIVKKIDKEAETIKLMRWLKLVPAYTLIALNAAFLPHFGLACAVSIGLLLINIVIIRLFVKSKPKKEYLDAIKNKQLVLSLLGPVLEELIIRGALLQLSILLISLAFPPALFLPFLNLGISVASAAAILITSVRYADNAEKNYAQVVAAFVSKLALGFFAVHFGLLISIGAHVLDNTILCSLMNLLPETSKESKEPKEEKMLQPRMG